MLKLPEVKHVENLDDPTTTLLHTKIIRKRFDLCSIPFPNILDLKNEKTQHC
jgi:hypothetical protein